MKFCTKMENGCRTCTRSQFWMGDDERRQFLTQQWGACWKEREETDQERGGLHRLQETSWKGVQGVRVWFEKQGVPFQTGSWSKRGSQWGPWDARNDKFLWMRPNRNFWSCCDTPLHHNILVLCCRHSIPQVHIYLVQKTRTLSRRHLEQMQIKHSVFGAVPHAPALRQFAAIGHKDVQVQPAGSITWCFPQAGLPLSAGGHSRTGQSMC